MRSSKPKAVLAEMQKSVESEKSGHGAVAVVIALAIVATLGFGGYKFHVAVQQKRIEREQKAEEARLARERAQAEQERRIAAEKADAIKNADTDTLRGLVSSCRSAIIDLVSKDPLGVNIPHYSPTDLEKFADIGAAFGQPLGWPSAALDNYDFDAVGWNVERIASKDYPVSTISFAVEGSQEGFTVRRFAAIYTCRLDGLAITKPTQTNIYYLD
ncbi:hypothetical protein [Sinorhizobium meliloti]